MCVATVGLHQLGARPMAVTSIALGSLRRRWTLVVARMRWSTHWLEVATAARGAERREWVRLCTRRRAEWIARWVTERVLRHVD